MRAKAMTIITAAMVLAPVGTAIAVPLMLGAGDSVGSGGRSDDCATASSSRACAHLNAVAPKVGSGMYLTSEHAVRPRFSSVRSLNMEEVGASGQGEMATALIGPASSAVALGQVEAGAGAGQAGAAGAGAGAAGAGGIAGLGVAGTVAAGVAAVAVTAVAVDQVASDDEDDAISP